MVRQQDVQISGDWNDPSLLGGGSCGGVLMSGNRINGLFNSGSVLYMEISNGYLDAAISGY